MGTALPEGLQLPAKLRRLRVQVWRWSQQRGWAQEGQTLLGHKDWVRDVAWAPSMGLPMNTIASASQDGTVIVWSEETPGVWEPSYLPDFQVPSSPLWTPAANLLHDSFMPWRVQQSEAGCLLVFKLERSCHEDCNLCLFIRSHFLHESCH